MATKNTQTPRVARAAMGLATAAVLAVAAAPAPRAQSTAPEPQSGMSGMSGMSAPPITEATPPPMPLPTTRGFDYWQPEWIMRDLWGPDRLSKGMEVRMKRHNTFMLKGVPEAYRTQHAMLPPTLGTIGESKDLYDRNCSTCHGADGMGDGDHANALSPSPALLAYMVHLPTAVDEYLLWSVSEGGAAFGSNMLAFKDKLTPDEIWKVVTYMRAGFPSPKANRL